MYIFHSNCACRPIFRPVAFSPSLRTPFHPTPSPHTYTHARVHTLYCFFFIVSHYTSLLLYELGMIGVMAPFRSQVRGFNIVKEATGVDWCVQKGNTSIIWAVLSYLSNLSIDLFLTSALHNDEPSPFVPLLGGRRAGQPNPTLHYCYPPPNIWHVMMMVDGRYRCIMESPVPLSRVGGRGGRCHCPIVRDLIAYLVRIHISIMNRCYQWEIKEKERKKERKKGSRGKGEGGRKKNSTSATSINVE
ncbi:hypothetical protein F5X96DRAFT_445597 [Biscogniauxia mediterranea]|nr:hypothetical protein F5X96DRAFT_445597 [Biscogniauxia mediterranea]